MFYLQLYILRKSFILSTYETHSFLLYVSIANNSHGELNSHEDANCDTVFLSFCSFQLNSLYGMSPTLFPVLGCILTVLFGVILGAIRSTTLVIHAFANCKCLLTINVDILYDIGPSNLNSPLIFLTGYIKRRRHPEDYKYSEASFYYFNCSWTVQKNSHLKRHIAKNAYVCS